MRHGNGLDIPEGLADVCAPDRMAVIVYDMQVGVLSQLPDGQEIIERVAGVVDAARSGGYPVVFLRHFFLPERLSGTFALRMAMNWQQVDSVDKVRFILQRDTPAFELVPELRPRADEVVFDKTSMSAFEGTPLASMLRDLRIGAYAIAGVALEIGIAPTVTHSTDLGFVPVVISDAVGGRDKDAMARAYADFEFQGHALVTDIATITPLLAGAD
ncbi:isochorismatase family cysteine hydrolase [Nocardia implantans]|uniref:Isochorismatase family cysteine hydrolase n=1 Tax=Nocardia implantans TaxID=3108168 RepID=A0ABU6AXS6_9NOCA|nr:MULTISPECIES: isochorismatase family cysteine hydrolase [unclassified Nocardia]MBF6190642.1 cysteine hydrolase [Nocardia beijingensis]MEA3528554.1 isochorismatase family cysteine hydrolase [Nocardia sp. CDC192]MEB3512294.1 isochorismatase family cysteine hydrolase [Nocardia sp. CDC186]